MKFLFNNILLFFCLLSLSFTNIKGFAINAAHSNHRSFFIVQENNSIQDIESPGGTAGILQALKLYERSVEQPTGIKLLKKNALFFTKSRFYIHTSVYYSSYHSRRNNNLTSTPIYISIRRIVV